MRKPSKQVAPAPVDAFAIARELLLEGQGLELAALERALSAAMVRKLDYVDLYLQLTRYETWTVEDGIVKEGAYSVDQGIGVRAVSGERTGFAYSDELDEAALTDAVVAGLHDGMARAGADDEVKLLVLTGAGRAFSAGYDIDQDLGVDSADSWWDVLEKDVAVTMRLRTFPKPTIAAVAGWCLGGACDLALACDLIIASEQAQFGQFWVRRGLVPDLGAVYLLPRLIGLHRAKELILTGRAFSAAEAFEWGMVNRVCAPDELVPAALETARAICANAPVSVRQAKKAIHYGLNVDLRTGLAFEIESNNRTVVTEDRLEGVRAFGEKRKPRFQGR